MANEYEPTGKEITIAALWNAQSDKECDDFLIEWGKFLTMCLWRRFLNWNYPWGKADTVHIDNFINGRENFGNRTQAMLDYMVTHGFLREVKKQTYRKGQRFKLGGYREEYLLALVDYSKCMLVCVSTGNWWSDSVHVDECTNVTVEELNKMANGISWKLIE